MPNPKLGTVTTAIKDAVLAAKRGQAEFRAEKRGIIASAVGKTSFGAPELRENIRAFLLALYDARPEGFKGTYFRAAFVSTTQGYGIPLDLAYVDPSSPAFLAPWDGKPAALEPAQQQVVVGGASSSASASASAAPRS
jgi:large subunit ribosomal protein L1